VLALLLRFCKVTAGDILNRRTIGLHGGAALSPSDRIKCGVDGIGAPKVAIGKVA
jgi:2-keto-4-pentenoate hydratase/2-oxohepta-3-ene-1,7-dioic acid hydratase in catechol pathway